MQAGGKRAANSLGGGRVSLRRSTKVTNRVAQKEVVEETRQNGPDSVSPSIGFLLSGREGDIRPYLEVSMFGVRIKALLDSGASRTVMGGAGWEIAKRLGLEPLKANVKELTVANGEPVAVVGLLPIPFRLEDRVDVIDVLVVPELRDRVILGADFIKSFAIVPDLATGNWHFGEDVSSEHLHSISSLRSKLTPEQGEWLNSQIEKYFSSVREGLGCSVDAEHVIRLTKGCDAPIKQRYYPVSPALQQQIDQELDQMLEAGVVEPSKSAWSSPILLVKKKDGTFRFCVDFRRLNKVTERDAYPLPYVSDTLDKLRNAKYLSSLDIKSAYWQIPMSPECKPYTAFTIPRRGLFQFCRMPFGLTNAPATWQRLIDKVIGGDLEPYVFVYLDDIIIVTPTFDLHMEVLLEVLRRITDAGLKLSREKCNFCRSELKYLGYVVDEDGLHVDPEKVKAMLAISAPRNVKEVRSFLGVISWYRRFVVNFSTLVAPLTNLLKKNRKFLWDSACDEAFQEARQKLVSAPILSCPDYSLPFVVQTDASDFGIGAVLTQQQEGGERVICYLSRSLSKQERKYTVTEKECLAVLWAVEKLRPYIEGSHFTVITDHHSLVWLQNLKDPTGRLARWAVRLQQYDFEIIHRRGKDHVVPDCLSRSVPVVDSVDEVASDKWYARMKKSVEKNSEKFSDWRIQGDKLFKYTRVSFPPLAEDSDYWKLVVPKEDRKETIRANHDEPTSGHAGIRRTYDRLKQNFYWPKMLCDVKAYVKRCKVCQSVKPELKRPAGVMETRREVTAPWQLIAVDLIGPLPRSSSGYQYILSVVDYFSKFTLFFPLRSATAKSVMQHLEDQVFLLFGAPRWLVCDNGPQFKSKEFQSLVASYGVRIVYNAHYHPQADPVERYNQTVETMLRAYVTENHRLWDKVLSKVACAIRTSTHEVTRFTPYFVNFGREMTLKGGDQEVPRDGFQVSGRDKIQDREKAFLDLQRDITLKIKKASDVSKRRYDLRRRDVRYSLNDLVWRKNYVLSDASKYFSAKLAPKYVGPFRISRKISSCVYELVGVNGKTAGTWHAKDLKPYLSD